MNKHYTDTNQNFKSDFLNGLMNTLNIYIDFLKPLSDLINTHNVQFLIDNQWTNSKIITDYFRTDLEELIAYSESERIIPNLVKYYVKNIKNENKLELSSLKELFTKLCELNNLWNSNVLTSPEELFKCLPDLNDYEKKLEENFSIIKKQNRFMNEKKRYEVDLMSKFVAKLCKMQNIRTIVDIGSGKAYLSAQLSSPLFNDAFNVIAIDSSQHNVESSMRRLSIMKRKTNLFSTSENKTLNDANNTSIESFQKSSKPKEALDNNFKTFSQFIQSSTELENLIKENLKIDYDVYALVGLHSCGNLSNSIVNLYLNNSNKKKLLCNVACCYNLLIEKYAIDEESLKDLRHTNMKIDDSSKFPLSMHLNSKKYFINFNARMLACHSLDRCLCYLEDFRELNNIDMWYRCILQVIILEKYYFPVVRNNHILYTNKLTNETILATDIQVGRNLIREKSSSMPNFCDYVRKALEKLKLNDHEITNEEINEYYEKFKTQKPQFDLYIQLKLLVSPIIEYIVLLDRLIYLYEIDSKSSHFLVKLFDPSISPRCHALISYVS